ncbi:Sorbosone dehydrogenase-domain-containing protein [Hyaloraphidium curvatum]|nr:Sorbosone dehydrogenase-domain-containing protein [Hyaloraphidium curvatum]
MIPLLLLALLALCGRALAWPSGLPGGVIAERVATFGDSVSDFQWLDEERLIIAGRRGRLVLFRNGRWSRVLVDITGRVAPSQGDRGLMGFAIDRDFYRGRPYIYIGYTVDPNHNGGGNYNMISRFTYRNDALQDERVIFGSTCRLDGSWNYNDNCSPMIGTTHSIGSLWFAGDGSLWVSVGEGQIHDGTFWYSNGQGLVDRALSMDPNFLGGKILRIDPDTGAGRRDNPFCNGGSVWSARCKVWAVGLRQPFRCSGGPNAVYCGEVGWYTWESLKVIYRGQNMGWPCWEGTNVSPGLVPGTPICQRILNGDNPYAGIPGNKGVLFQWNHDGASSAAIGGVQIPSYYPGVGGRWIVADYTSGRVWAVSPGGGTVTFFYGGDGPCTFRVGTDGWLYYLSQAQQGSVIRFRISGFTPPPNPTVPRLTTARPVPTTSKRPPDPLCDPTGAARIVVPTCAAATGQQPIGDLTFLSREGWPRSRLRFARNGNWGPVGLDASVGLSGQANTGRTLNINNRWYITGWGTHALSQIDVLLNRCCYRITGVVGVDEEVRRFYPHYGLNNTGPQLNVSGSWTVRTVDDSRVVWNSSLVRRMDLGSNPLSFDIRGLHRFNRVSLQAAVAPHLDPRRGEVWQPSHFNWAEVKAYCGPSSPYAPIVTMTQPPEGLIAPPDTNVQFAATATYWDRRTAVPASMFTWDVNLVHCQGFLCHQHSPYQFKGVLSGTFNAASHA